MDKSPNQSPGRRKGNPRRKGLHKGAVLQPPGSGRVFKGVGVVKRYCGINLIAIPLFKDSRQPGSGPALAETVLDCGCADEHAFVLKGTRGALSTRNTQFCYLVDYALCLLVVLTDAVISYPG